MKYLVIISFLIISTLQINAQSKSPVNPDACPPTSNKSARKLFEKAMKTTGLEKKELLAAAIKEEPDFYEAIFEFGLNHTKAQEAKSAKFRFEKVMDLCPDYSPYTWFWLGKIYFGEENYSRAVSMLNKFIKYTGETVNIKDEDFAEANSLMKQANSFKELTQNKVPFNPLPVLDICTPLDEYLAMLTPDNEHMYFIRKIPDNKTALQYRETFMVSKNDNWHFDSGTPLPPPFNVFNNNGAATITADNKTMYFVICENNQLNYCDIWYSTKTRTGWEAFKNVGGGVNVTDKWDSQPTISFNGQEMVFTSNRTGGLGGADLYITRRKPDGSWGTPENLGNVVNTPENEISPFLHSDSKTLYFSSKGHKSLGGYDIFYTKQNEKGEWSKPVNLGSPINTSGDELGFFVSLDGKRGFYGSDKLKGPGGKDLYMFDLYEAVRPEKVKMVKGDLKVEDGIKMADEIEIKNLRTKETTVVKVDQEDGKFVSIVSDNDDHIMTIKKEGIAFTSAVIKGGEETGTVVNTELEMKKTQVGQAYTLNNIVFATNSFELSEDAKYTIESFADYLKVNPTLKVAIHGHTDDVGDNDANLILSQQRAQAVYEYLISLDIAATRLSHKGFGETKPIADNFTDSGRAKNRRTEFVIISK